LKIPSKFLENPQILNLIKIRPVGTELFHADRQTTNGQEDMLNAAKKISYICA